MCANNVYVESVHKTGEQGKNNSIFILGSSQTLKATSTTLLQKTAMKINNSNTSLKDKAVTHKPLLF